LIQRALHRGVVTEFSDARGLGTVTSTDEGGSYVFHVIEIADGTRTIEVGQTVLFEHLHRLGDVQAGSITKV
jgi:cold shock CspA family protein